MSDLHPAWYAIIGTGGVIFGFGTAMDWSFVAGLGGLILGVGFAPWATVEGSDDG